MHCYQAHEAITSDIKMYYKLVLLGFLLGLLVQVIVIGVGVRRSYLREF